MNSAKYFEISNNLLQGISQSNYILFRKVLLSFFSFLLHLSPSQSSTRVSGWEEATALKHHIARVVFSPRHALERVLSLSAFQMRGAGVFSDINVYVLPEAIGLSQSTGTRANSSGNCNPRASVWATWTSSPRQVLAHQASVDVLKISPPSLNSPIPNSPVSSANCVPSQLIASLAH